MDFKNEIEKSDNPTLTLALLMDAFSESCKGVISEEDLIEMKGVSVKMAATLNESKVHPIKALFLLSRMFTMIVYEMEASFKTEAKVKH